MTAPLPFTNKEAEETADWIEDLAEQSSEADGVLQRVVLQMSLEMAGRIAASLRWMATER